jgi:P-type Mg2+ transporter
MPSTAADVAKDAADIVMLEKDLGVLAEGVVEGGESSRTRSSTS